MPLTSDNSQLSGVKNEPCGTKNDAPIQELCMHRSLARSSEHAVCEKAIDLIRHSLAANTERAYQSDLTHYQQWGGTVPATPEMICAYIGEHAGKLSVATIRRRVSTISKLHEARRVSNPCKNEIVKATLRGLKRKHGTAQHQAKPLLRDDLFLLLDRLGDNIRDHRDRALLLLGFAGGFRRSELVALECSDIEQVRQGVVLTVRRSKTDQEGGGRRIGVPYGRTRYCPVAALERWIQIARIENGPLFRPVTKHGHIVDGGLSGDAVSAILRERLASVGIDPTGYSGHSLRAGFATSAVQAGVSSLKIRAQTGHASDEMLSRYVREGELFIENAAAALL